MSFGKAVFIAAREHMTVRDKGGHAYILHPMRIAMRLRTKDEELMSIAILHDVIEDSKVTFEDLKAEGFSDRVIDALRLLTHQKGVSYNDYIAAMRDNVDALLVKREDLKDNSDITRQGCDAEGPGTIAEVSAVLPDRRSNASRTWQIRRTKMSAAAFETVKVRESYTPRHLRRKGNASRNGPGAQEKSRIFRSAKGYSDLFIHQSASMLEKIGQPYKDWCDKSDRGGGALRGTK